MKTPYTFDVGCLPPSKEQGTVYCFFAFFTVFFAFLGAAFFTAFFAFFFAAMVIHLPFFLSSFGQHRDDAFVSVNYRTR